MSLAAIFDGQSQRPAGSAMTLDRLIGLAERGGWPAAIGNKNAPALARAYVDQLALADVSAAAGSDRDSAKIRVMVGSLARNTATLVQVPTIRRDMARWGPRQRGCGRI